MSPGSQPVLQTIWNARTHSIMSFKIFYLAYSLDKSDTSSGDSKKFAELFNSSGVKIVMNTMNKGISIHYNKHVQFFRKQ